MKFQLANKLPVTGLFDEATRAKINGSTSSVSTVVTPTPVVASTPTPTVTPTPSVNTTPAPIVTSNTNPSSSTFTRDLYADTTGSDVRALQIYLNTNGYIITPSGPGSPGNESDYFGNLMQAALIKFQQDRGIIPASGYFGELTRGIMNRSTGR